MKSEIFWIDQVSGYRRLNLGIIDHPEHDTGDDQQEADPIRDPHQISSLEIVRDDLALSIQPDLS